MEMEIILFALLCADPGKATELSVMGTYITYEYCKEEGKKEEYRSRKQCKCINKPTKIKLKETNGTN